MRHYQDTNGSTRNSPLLEQVFSILDSRIQFIDFQVQRYFHTYTSSISDTSKSEYTYHGPSDSNNLVNNLDQVLNFTEEFQNDLKLLQTLRAWLKEETVQDVLDLLTNNKYLTFQEENLTHLLRQKALAPYQLEMAY